jgi:hypothetical protein
LTDDQLPRLPGLAPEQLSRGGEPQLLALELRDVIERAITNHPRSQQTRIGPSEIGTPCIRKLGYKLARTQSVNRRTSWRPTVGTAVHAWLAETFTIYNNALGFARYLTELRVNVGEVNGMPITGSVDLYDRVTCTVVDWKIVGATTLKKAKAEGPSDTYRIQSQLYGRGINRRGLPVDQVAVMYLPVSGELTQAVYRPMPYDETQAVSALALATGIDMAMKSVGPEKVIAGLPMRDDYCVSCPWFNPTSQNVAAGCPGRVDALYARSAKQLEGIIAP